MDEDAEVRDGKLLLKKTAAPGDFVFEAGHLLPAGVVVGSQGQIVTPGRAAVMTRSFVESACVLPSPSVAVLSLGNEVVRPEETPNPGAFRSDNLVIATALLARCGADVVVADTVDDTDEAMDEAFSRIPSHGLVITMGGTGRGDHDLARASARRAGYEIVVDGVALRPGNSMFAAVRENSLLLGLPGPPFAVSPLLFAFAVPLVRRFRGLPSADVEARLAAPLTSRKGLEWLAPCHLAFDGPVLLAHPLVDVAMTPLQEIAALDAYLPIPSDKNLSAGTIVSVLCGPDFI
jgi:molybdopterin molybdotransferase